MLCSSEPGFGRASTREEGRKGQYGRSYLDVDDPRTS